MFKNYVFIKIRVYILPKLSIFRIRIFLYSYWFSLRVSHEFFSKIYEILRTSAARAPCANFRVVKYTVDCTFESTKLVQESASYSTNFSRE